MAMLNFGCSEVSGGGCQGLAGMKCDEYHTHIAAVSNDPYECIKNNVPSRAMHISFSGYYGYLPHVQSSTSDYAMDTTDDVARASINDQNSNVYGYSSSNTQTVNDRMMQVQFVRRKRNCGEAEQTETSKRLRTEEQETIYGKDTERSQRFLTEEYDLELENLLKQTHGCDLYHFYSCDI